MEYKHLSAGLELLTGAFGEPLTESLSNAYWIVLKDADPAVFLDAVRHEIANAERMPRPKHLLAAIRERDPRLAHAEDGARLKRSALAHGFFPANWDHDRYLEECRAMGVAPRDGAVEFYATTGRPGAT